MATKTYKNYTPDESGYAAMIADIKAIMTWSDVIESETSTEFRTSNGGHLVVFTSDVGNGIVAYCDESTRQFTNIQSICFIKTTKAATIVCGYGDSLEGDWLSDSLNNTPSSYFNAVVISSAINTQDNSVCDDQMTIVNFCAGRAYVQHIDETAAGITGPGDITFDINIRARTTLAVGLYSPRSAYISTNAFVLLTSSREDRWGTAVSIGGKKYYEFGAILLADD